MSLGPSFPDSERRTLSAPLTPYPVRCRTDLRTSDTPAPTPDLGPPDSRAGPTRGPRRGRSRARKEETGVRHGRPTPDVEITEYPEPFRVRKSCHTPFPLTHPSNPPRHYGHLGRRAGDGPVRPWEVPTVLCREGEGREVSRVTSTSLVDMSSTRWSSHPQLLTPSVPVSGGSPGGHFTERLPIPVVCLRSLSLEESVSSFRRHLGNLKLDLGLLQNQNQILNTEG